MATHKPARAPARAEKDHDLRRAGPIVAAAIIAAVGLIPVLIGVALAWFTEVVALRVRWLAVALAVGVAGLLLTGWEPAMRAYLDVAPVWQVGESYDRLGVSGMFTALMPVSGPAAIAVAIGARLWWEHRRPFWRETPVRRSPVQKLRSRRAAKKVAEGTFDPKGGVLLGTDDSGEPVIIGPEELGQHGLIVGATGSGKTHTLMQLLSGLARIERALVVVDLKADPKVASDLQAVAQANGVGFHHWSMNGDTHWDPLAHGDPIELTDKLIGLEDWTEPHYKRAAERYLRIAIGVQAADWGRASLDALADLLDPATLLQHVDRPEVSERDRAWLATLDESARSAALGLSNRISLLSGGRLGELLTDPDESGIDLATSLARNEVVLFSLDAPRYPEAAPHLARLVMADLGAICSRRLQAGEKNAAVVAVDEFSAMRSDAVLPLLARARSAGLGMLLATQELADLDRVDPAFASQVLGNVAIILAHRQNVPESCERIAGIAGTTNAWAETYQVDQVDGRSTDMGSVREVERFVVHPNELKALGVGLGVVLRRLTGDAARVHVTSTPLSIEGRASRSKALRSCR